MDDKQTEVESNEDGASKIDGNAVEQRESGDTNDVDPEKGEDRVDTGQELETDDTTQKLKSPQASTHCGKGDTGEDTWFRRLCPRVKRKNH